MLLDPSGRALGMDAMLPYFQVLPFADVLFRDLTFSGWALLIVNGLTNLTAAGLLLAEKRAGVTLGGLFGVTLMLWICIQFYMFPPNCHCVQKVDPVLHCEGRRRKRSCVSISLNSGWPTYTARKRQDRIVWTRLRTIRFSSDDQNGQRGAQIR